MLQNGVRRLCHDAVLKVIRDMLESAGDNGHKPAYVNYLSGPSLGHPEYERFSHSRGPGGGLVPPKGRADQETVPRSIGRRVAASFEEGMCRGRAWGAPACNARQ